MSDQSQQTTEQPKCTYGRMTKGLRNCHADATHTGGGYYPGPVCERHKAKKSKPLGDDDDE